MEMMTIKEFIYKVPPAFKADFIVASRDVFDDDEKYNVEELQRFLNHIMSLIHDRRGF